MKKLRYNQHHHIKTKTTVGSCGGIGELMWGVERTRLIFHTNIHSLPLLTVLCKLNYLFSGLVFSNLDVVAVGVPCESKGTNYAR